MVEASIYRWVLMDGSQIKPIEALQAILEMDNIAEQLPDEELAVIGQDVVTEHGIDWSAVNPTTSYNRVQRYNILSSKSQISKKHTFGEFKGKNLRYKTD